MATGAVRSRSRSVLGPVLPRSSAVQEGSGAWRRAGGEAGCVQEFVLMERASWLNCM